jgi:hypothetical protein
MKGFINLTQTNNDKVNNLEKLVQEKLDKKPNGTNALIDENTGKLSEMYFDTQIVKDAVDKEVQNINAVQIRNIEPNLIINSIVADVQEVATQYIVDNYNRQPQQNDGLFITLTDANNDANQQLVEASEDTNETKLSTVDEHIVQIYQLLKDVTTGASSLHVIPEGYGLT